MQPLLEIRDLAINFYTYRGVVKALDGIDLIIGHGESVGLVGETGCGKSVTARAAIGFIEPPGERERGEILLDGRDILSLDDEGLRSIRGREISFIFQEPKKALNPSATVGSQLVEAATTARDIGKQEAAGIAAEMLEIVGLGDSERIMRAYSYELSGGMAQRVMIAIAMVGGSRLLIADEPTSALDVSIQAQILQVLRDIRTRQESSLLLITHDLGVAAENCDRIAVMYAGRIVEFGPVRQIFANPAHPYTRKLLDALPTLGRTELAAIPGSVPDLISPPPGCRFSNRCDRASEICESQRPPWAPIGDGHNAACHHPLVEPATAAAS